MKIIPQYRPGSVGSSQQSAAPAPAEIPAQIGQEDTIEGDQSGGSDEVTQEQKKEMLSPKYARLAQKEQAIRERELALKAREDALKAKEQEYQTSYVPKSDISKKLLENTDEAMNEFGLSYDTLTEAMLRTPADPQAKAFDELRNEIKELKAEREKEKQEQVDRQKSDYEKAVNTIRDQVTGLVDEDPEFEAIKAFDAVEMVVEKIKEHHAKTGQVLSNKEACQQIEEYLVEEALKAAQVKKVQDKLALKSAESLEESKTPAPKSPSLDASKAPAAKPAMKTLNNRMSSAPRMTAKERAILAFQGKLNS